MRARDHKPLTFTEGLWSGDFGNAYVERNRDAGDLRGTFWGALLEELQPASVLEVGCNVGANLQHLDGAVSGEGLWGIDINMPALRGLRKRLPDVNAVWAKARDLPFRDHMFDLVFTSGVLIHQPPDVLPIVMNEIVRCSSRNVLAIEYFAESITPVPYRSVEGALWKADYGSLYGNLFPELRLMRSGYLDRDQGWDRCNYWLFSRAV